MTLAEEVRVLREENQCLRLANTQLAEQNAMLREELEGALQRIAEIEEAQKQPPSWVKRNKPLREGPKPPRRKRGAEHNRGRQREARVTRWCEHALERCPECNHRLRGHSVARRRQVIDLPEPQPIEVTEHVIIKRKCPRCGRWRVPSLDLGGQVLGQGRLGVRLISLIGYLRITLRLTDRAIQDYLATCHGLELSVGEIVAVQQQLASAAQPAVRALREQVRASDRVNGDETGWREDGQNGWVWTFSTPGEEAIRYYEYDRSRSQKVVTRILGPGYQGVLSSDFCASYNVHRGRHQRCWVHLLRDLHKLKAEHDQEAETVRWAQAVRALHDQAQAFLAGPAPPSREEREKRYVVLMAETDALGLLYAREKKHPCQALAKRLLRHEDELFQFVLVPGLSADNNLAERSLRPLVVARKISGGTRSAKGSRTRMALATLFGTWQARGLNPFTECINLLQQTSLPQV